jgi:uncharacterized protein (DUF952 family)
MLILHIAISEEWADAKAWGAYRSPTLAADGFIHCSLPAQVLGVADSLFAGQTGLSLLCIDSDMLTSELRFEASGGERFPHIYGPLNIDAVSAVHDFPPNADGRFTLPPGLGAGSKR